MRGRPRSSSRFPIAKPPTCVATVYATLAGKGGLVLRTSCRRRLSTSMRALAAVMPGRLCGLGGGGWRLRRTRRARPQAGNGIEAVGTAAWPAVAAQLAKNIARDSFAHDYTRVWAYLHPAYRQAVSQSRWQACQRIASGRSAQRHDHEVAVAQATELPVRPLAARPPEGAGDPALRPVQDAGARRAAGRGPVHVLAEAREEVDGCLAERRVRRIQGRQVLRDAAGPAPLY